VGQLCTGIEELQIDGCRCDFRGHLTLLACLLSCLSFCCLMLENLHLTDTHFNHLAPATVCSFKSLMISFCSHLVDLLPIIDAKLLVAGHQSTLTMAAKSESNSNHVTTNAKREALLRMGLESKPMDEDKEERESAEADWVENEEEKKKEQRQLHNVHHLAVTHTVAWWLLTTCSSSWYNCFNCCTICITLLGW